MVAKLVLNIESPQHFQLFFNRMLIKEQNTVKEKLSVK